MTALIGPSSLVHGPAKSVPGVRGLVTPRRLDAVVGTPEAGGFVLHHYQRAQDRPDRGWSRLSTVSTAALGPGALASAAGHLEALVPEPSGVVHYRGTAQGSWRRLQVVTRGGVVSLAATPTRLVALIAGPGGVGTWLFDGFWRAGVHLPGIGAAVAVNDRAVVLGVVDQGQDLVWCEFGEGSWSTRGRVTSRGTAPASLAWDREGWLLAVPREDVVETWRLQDGRWRIAEVLTWGAGRIDGVSLAASRLHGWVQALTDEEGSVFHHHRQGRHSGAARWMRSACLRLHDPEPFVLDPNESVKLAQVSGEVDSQPTPWGERRPTLSRSDTSAGIRGTDLGIRVDHAGEAFLLFGDTHWRRPWLTTRDAIARVTPRGPLPGLPGVEFHGSPLKVVGGPATMREYDVPLDGFSHAGQFFAFFSSHHFDREQTMGRSLLTRALDPAVPVDPRARHPLRFRQLTTFSTRHFINVSVQLLPATAVPGFDGDQDLLLVWGSGAYRAGDLRLAVLDPSVPHVAHALAGHRRIDVSALGLRYWAGTDGRVPRWVDDEDKSRPLLYPGAFGEVSVRWVPEVGRYLLLSGAGPEDPMGPAITLRTATAPWGPWSPRRRLLDWVATGMSHHDPFSRFIRASADGDDPVGDRIFRAQAAMTGAAYAPYFFDAERDGDDLVLRYTLSTWNPYQVVLMRHRLAVGELVAGEGVGPV